MLSDAAPSITAHRIIGIIATFSINDTHHDALLRVTLYYYAECRYPLYCNTDIWHKNSQHCKTVRCYAKCRYAECRGVQY